MGGARFRGEDGGAGAAAEKTRGAVLRGAGAAAAGRAWAACLKKIFEVDPVMCGKCGSEMRLVSVILDDRELDRILANQGWPVEFPTSSRTSRPARAAVRPSSSSSAGTCAR
jgi:hypothetical protein